MCCTSCPLEKNRGVALLHPRCGVMRNSPETIHNWSFNGMIPSGKLLHNYGKSPFSMGKSTISIGIFNSFLFVYQGTLKISPNFCWDVHTVLANPHPFMIFPFRTKPPWRRHFPAAMFAGEITSKKTWNHHQQKPMKSSLFMAISPWNHHEITS